MDKEYLFKSHSIAIFIISINKRIKNVKELKKGKRKYKRK